MSTDAQAKEAELLERLSESFTDASVRLLDARLQAYEHMSKLKLSGDSFTEEYTRFLQEKVDEMLDNRS